MQYIKKYWAALVAIAVGIGALLLGRRHRPTEVEARKEAAQHQGEAEAHEVAAATADERAKELEANAVTARQSAWSMSSEELIRSINSLPSTDERNSN